ncbi:MAG: hypothetical protein ACR2IS_12945, partial [Nitrososphaeraceae archaeon]
MINKPAIITFMLLLAVTGGTIAISIPVLSSDAQGQGEPSNRNTTSASRTINVTIGDLILESSGLPIRVLDIGG